MQLSDKDQAIIVQVAAKIAAEVVFSDNAILAIRNGTYHEVMEVVHACMLQMINDPALPASTVARAGLQSGLTVAALAPVVSITPEAQAQQAAVDKVLSEIPGATVTSDIPTIDHQPSAPTAIHEKSSMVEMLEDALIHNPHNWKVWDTDKATMNGGNSPDITHETLMQTGSAFKVGVFMVSKYAGQSAPEWAWSKLGKLEQYSQFVAAGKITL